MSTWTSSDHISHNPPERPTEGTTKLACVLKRLLRWAVVHFDERVSETKVTWAPVEYINLARYSIFLELLRFLPLPLQFQPMSFSCAVGGATVRVSPTAGSSPAHVDWWSKSVAARGLLNDISPESPLMKNAREEVLQKINRVGSTWLRTSTHGRIKESA
jgi:hypothetical protein